MRAITQTPRPLAPDCHAVLIEDDLVVLFLDADRYACLPGVGGEIVLDPEQRTLASRDTALLEELVAGGVLTDGQARPALEARAWPGAPAQSLYPDRPEALDRRRATMAVPILALAARQYRKASLAQIVAWAIAGRRAPTDAASPMPAGLSPCVADFHAWALFAPTSGKCLLRSFLLLAQLRRAGHDALWVFGVATWPFAAHCWLQRGDVVLDDTCERVSRYRPILVI